MKKIILLVVIMMAFVNAFCQTSWLIQRRVNPAMVKADSALVIPAVNFDYAPYSNKDSIGRIWFNTSTQKFMGQFTTSSKKSMASEDSVQARWDSARVKTYGSNLLMVNSISELRADNGYAFTNKRAAFLRGYYAIGDGGGGVFYWDSTSTATDNNGTIIKPTSAGTGRWMRDINPATSTINVKWFGAKGDSTTDDAAAIQAAVNATRQGGTVYFPATGQVGLLKPCYTINSTINVDTMGITFYSSGDYETGSIIKSAVASPLVLIRTSAMSIRGLTFVGNGGILLSPVPTNNGIYINGDSGGNADLTIRNCLFFLLNQSITTKARNVNVYDNIFSNSRYGLVVDTILIAGEMRGFVVERNRFHTVGKFQLTDAAIYSTDKTNFEFQISNNYLDGQSNCYFALLKASKNVLITDNHVTLNRSGFIKLDTCTLFTIANNELIGNTLSPASVPGIELNGSGFGTISGNTISLTQQEAIKLYNGGCVSNLIIGNTLSDFSAQTSSGYYGISITSACTNNVISNNSLRSPTYTPAGSISNGNLLNTIYNNPYNPAASLGKPADLEVNGSVMFNSTLQSAQSLFRTGQGSGTNVLRMQAGEGSDTWGGGISLFGAGHATYPGHVRVGLSSNASAKFVVNTAGLTTSGTDLFTVLETGNVGIGISTPGTKLTVNGNASISHLIGNTAAPTATIGSSMTGSVAVSGTDAAGIITVTITSSTSFPTLAEYFTLTFASSYASAPYVVFTPGNSSTAALTALYLKNPTTTGFQIASANSGTTPASATYIWYYNVIQ